ncbi:hypothetical protein AB4Y95_00100 [Arthrobacter sp. M-10]|uniref:hypothetical protein n=1 Tax=Arthrobacter sp. M-10 TaxID=3233037 RepID=UPI003F93C802
MDSPQHNQVDKNDIKIALLENNAVIFERMDKAIHENGASITKAVEKKTDSFITEITNLAKVQGEHSIEIAALNSRYDKIWSKVATALAISNVIVGGIVYLVVGGHVGK